MQVLDFARSAVSGNKKAHMSLERGSGMSSVENNGKRENPILLNTTHAPD